MSRRLIRDAPATAFVLASTRMAIKHRVQTPIKTMQRKMRQCHKDVHAAKSVIATSQHTLYTRGLAEQKVRTRSPAELHAADDVNLTRMKCTLFVEAGPLGTSNRRLHQTILHPETVRRFGYHESDAEMTRALPA